MNEDMVTIQIPRKARDGLRSMVKYMEEQNPLAIIGLPPDTPTREIPAELFKIYSDIAHAIGWIEETLYSNEDILQEIM